MTVGFYHDERCLWHHGGNYAMNIPVGGFVQPLPGGLPESPETKRRLKNLLEVSGLWTELRVTSAPPADPAMLSRVHPDSYLRAFAAMSAAGGGEIGHHAPFGPGGFDIAALSAGLACRAVADVCDGRVARAYALSRPPGHHCEAARPMGYCLLANIAIAVEEALARGLAGRVAVLDWDVHHGNGTEAIFLDRGEVLTVSIHQDRNYPVDTGGADVTGTGAGRGANINVPLPPGTGHAGYLAAMDRIVLPALHRFRPDLIVVACGYDAAAVDPLGRMLASAATFRAMTVRVMAAAADLCGGRLVLVHEGGYSEAYVPFCGHAVLEEMTGSAIHVPDPMAEVLDARQPGPEFDAFVSHRIDALAASYPHVPR